MTSLSGVRHWSPSTRNSERAPAVAWLPSRATNGLVVVLGGFSSWSYYVRSRLVGNGEWRTTRAQGSRACPVFASPLMSLCHVPYSVPGRRKSFMAQKAGTKTNNARLRGSLRLVMNLALEWRRSPEDKRGWLMGWDPAKETGV